MMNSMRIPGTIALVIGAFQATTKKAMVSLLYLAIQNVYPSASDDAVSYLYEHASNLQKYFESLSNRKLFTTTPHGTKLETDNAPDIQEIRKASTDIGTEINSLVDSGKYEFISKENFSEATEGLGFLKPLMTLIFLIAAVLGLTPVINLKVLKTFHETIHKLAVSSRDLKTLFGDSGDVVDEALTFIYGIFGKEYITPKLANLKRFSSKIHDLNDKVNNMIDTARYDPTSIWRSEHYGILTSVYNDLKNTYNLVTDNEKSLYNKHDILTHIFSNLNTFRELRVSMVRGNTGKQEPTCLWIFGRAGIGKTYTMLKIASKLTSECGISSYSRNVTEDHVNGYTHQSIFIMNDINQRADNKDHTEFMTFKDSSACNVNMASLTEKNTPFVSRFLLCSSNVGWISKSKTITDIPAFHRRRDALIFAYNPQYAAYLESPEGILSPTPSATWLTANPTRFYVCASHIANDIRDVRFTGPDTNGVYREVTFDQIYDYMKAREHQYAMDHYSKLVRAGLCTYNRKFCEENEISLQICNNWSEANNACVLARAKIPPVVTLSKKPQSMADGDEEVIVTNPNKPIKYGLCTPYKFVSYTGDCFTTISTLNDYFSKYFNLPGSYIVLDGVRVEPSCPFKDVITNYELIEEYKFDLRTPTDSVNLETLKDNIDCYKVNVTGERRALLLTGPPGTGKSFATNMLRHEPDCIYVESYTPELLVNTKSKLLIFEDITMDHKLFDLALNCVKRFFVGDLDVRGIILTANMGRYESLHSDSVYALMRRCFVLQTQLNSLTSIKARLLHHTPDSYLITIPDWDDRVKILSLSLVDTGASHIFPNLFNIHIPLTMSHLIPLVTTYRDLEQKIESKVTQVAPCRLPSFPDVELKVDMGMTFKELIETDRVSFMSVLKMRIYERQLDGSYRAILPTQIIDNARTVYTMLTSHAFGDVEQFVMSFNADKINVKIPSILVMYHDVSIGFVYCDENVEDTCVKAFIVDQRIFDLDIHIAPDKITSGRDVVYSTPHNTHLFKALKACDTRTIKAEIVDESVVGPVLFGIEKYSAWLKPLHALINITLSTTAIFFTLGAFTAPAADETVTFERKGGDHPSSLKTQQPSTVVTYDDLGAHRQRKMRTVVEARNGQGLYTPSLKSTSSFLDSSSYDPADPTTYTSRNVRPIVLETSSFFLEYPSTLFPMNEIRHGAYMQCISADQAMSAGVAKMFNYIFGRLTTPNAQVGDVLHYKMRGVSLYYLVTKSKHYDKPLLENYFSTLTRAFAMMNEHGIKHIASGRLGCCLDDLMWAKCKQQIEKLAISSNVRVSIYHSAHFFDKHVVDGDILTNNGHWGIKYGDYIFTATSTDYDDKTEWLIQSMPISSDWTSYNTHSKEFDFAMVGEQLGKTFALPKNIDGDEAWIHLMAPDVPVDINSDVLVGLCKQLFTNKAGIPKSTYERYLENTMIDLAKPESAVDIAAMRASLTLNNNLVYMYSIENKTSCLGLMLRDKIGLTVKHLNPIVSVCIPTTKAIYRAKTIYQHPTKDLQLFEILDVQCKSFPCIINNFVPPSAMERILNNHLRSIPVLQTYLLPNNTLLLQYATVDTNMSTGVDDVKGYASTVSSFTTTGVSDDGFCGAVLSVVDSTVNQKYIGIHNSGSLYRSFFVPVTSDLLQTMLSSVARTEQLVYRNNHVYNDITPSYNSELQTMHVGTIHEPIVPPNKTRLYQTDFDNLPPCPFSPSITSLGDTRTDKDVFFEGIKRYTVPRPPTDVTDDELIDASNCIGNYLANKIILNGCSTHVLSVDESINGCNPMQYPNMSSIDGTGAVGYPYNHRDRRLGNRNQKRDFMQQHDNERWYFKNDLVSQQILSDTQQIIVDAKQGTRPDRVFTPLCKDELLKNEKTSGSTAKTRIIFSGDFAYLLAFRMMFLSAMCRIQDIHQSIPIKIGIRSNKSSWTQLYYHMARVSTVGFDCDFSSFDSTIPTKFMHYCTRVYNIIYQKTDPKWHSEHDTARFAIHSTIENAKILVGRGVYQLFRGQISGNPATAMDNSLIVWMVYYIAYRRIMKAHAQEHLINFSHFMTVMAMAIYGDDHNVAVHSAAQDILNYESFKKEIKNMGFDLTPADKNAETCDFKPVSEMTFLKRSFLKCDSFYLPQLDIQSITKTLYWARSSPAYEITCPRDFRTLTEVEPFQMSLNSMLPELSLHGRALYDSLVKTILAGCRQHFFDVNITSFEEAYAFKML